MKPIDEQSMFDLLPLEPKDLELAVLRFEDVISTLFWRKGDCKRMIDEGFIQVTALRLGDVPCYLLGYHLTDDGGLWIDIAQKVTKEQTTLKLDCQFLAHGVDLLAKREKRRYVRFYTARRGLATFAKDYGYQPEAVLLTKGVA